MNPKQFLLIGGAVLVLVGILGFLGIIGPTAEDSIFGGNWFFDNGENWAHLILGIVALGAYFLITSAPLLKYLVLAVGVLAVVVGLLGFFLGAAVPNFLGANLENPADNVLHLVIGAWALYAGMMGE